MAHNSSLLLAPGSQRDSEKKKNITHTHTKRMIWQQKAQLSPHPYQRSSTAFHQPPSPTLPKPRVISQVPGENLVLWWPVAKTHFKTGIFAYKPLLANSVC